MPSFEKALAAAAGWIDRLADLSGHPPFPDPATLFERAAPATRGSRILRTADGWWCLTLSRDADRELVPALVSGDSAMDPWEAVASWSLTITAREALERAILLGLPASTLPTDPAPPLPAPPSVHAVGPWPPRVVDLSSLWAGPLCAHLLQLCGASVIKVESTERPDALRFGDPQLYSRINGGKGEAAVELSNREGRAVLLDLLNNADIVIESSRPRAMAQLGIDAESLVRSIPSLTWVSITAYGRNDAPQRVGFGDDIAFGAGLVSIGADGRPALIGDALADPLTGIYAALAACGAHQSGSRGLLDISMHRVASAAT